MMSLSPLLQQLVDSLQCLPGVGPKSAQRMAFQLLKSKRDAGKSLAQTLLRAMTDIKHCLRCRTFCEASLCPCCADPKRDPSLLCVVETPLDQWVVEQSGSYRGLYFVLLGHLSPLEGIGPLEIGFDLLKERLAAEPIAEVILATNTTVEGEATAYFIAELVKKHHKSVSRIAYGIPIGGELEYIDSSTLNRAFSHRNELHTSEKV
jgi:recombination protein RecR